MYKLNGEDLQKGNIFRNLHCWENALISETVIGAVLAGRMTPFCP
jgi:hypothetical protein